MNQMFVSVAATLALLLLASYVHVSLGPPAAYVAFAAAVLAFWHTLGGLRSMVFSR